MSTVPALTKKLRSVRAAGKLSGAMKTVSAAKFSRLSSLNKYYSRYAEQYAFVCGTADPAAEAETVVVFGSNRGFCGSFNTAVVQLLTDEVLSRGTPAHLIVCGEEMIRAVRAAGLVPEHTFTFPDVPSFEDCAGLCSLLGSLAGERTDYPVRLVRPFFKNTMTQIPGEELLLLRPTAGPNSRDSCDSCDGVFWLPDRETFLRTAAEEGSRALIFRAVTQTALGAQAATLMTMRSAYDTASEYTARLEGEIHRQRQRAVTADVLETASERGSKGDSSYGT